MIHQGRLTTLGMSGILSSFDLATGKLLWRADQSARVSTKKLFCGTSASPLVDGDSVIVHLGDDVGGGVLVAFDAASGEQRWSWQGAGPGYASPASLSQPPFTPSREREEGRCGGMTCREIFGASSHAGGFGWAAFRVGGVSGRRGFG